MKHYKRVLVLIYLDTTPSTTYAPLIVDCDSLCWLSILLKFARNIGWYSWMLTRSIRHMIDRKPQNRMSWLQRKIYCWKYPWINFFANNNSKDINIKRAFKMLWHKQLPTFVSYIFYDLIDFVVTCSSIDAVMTNEFCWWVCTHAASTCSDHGANCIWTRRSEKRTRKTKWLAWNIHWMIYYSDVVTQ